MCWPQSFTWTRFESKVSFLSHGTPRKTSYSSLAFSAYFSLLFLEDPFGDSGGRNGGRHRSSTCIPSEKVKIYYTFNFY